MSSMNMFKTCSARTEFSKFVSINAILINLAASQVKNSNMAKNHLDVYSPFRLLADFAGQNYDLKT
jgi:hypothetical protein